jgi:MFS family permease
MTEIAVGAASPLVQDQATQLRRAIIASTIGTTIEWYDFYIYTIATGLVFAKLFFPESDPLTGTLQAFGVYAVGFISRPIGAVIFGHYGDRIGPQIDPHRHVDAHGHCDFPRGAGADL